MLRMIGMVFVSIFHSIIVSTLFPLVIITIITDSQPEVTGTAQSYGQVFGTLGLLYLAIPILSVILTFPIYIYYRRGKGKLMWLATIIGIVVFAVYLQFSRGFQNFF